MTAIRYTLASLAVFTLAAVAGSLAARYAFDNLPPAWFDLDDIEVVPL